MLAGSHGNCIALSSLVGREGWIFSEAMLDHLGCKGVPAVAVGRNAEGCQLFGEEALVRTGRGTELLWINRTAVAGRSPCCLAHPWDRMRFSGEGCMCVCCLGGEEICGRGARMAARQSLQSVLSLSPRSSLQSPSSGARSPSR